MDAETLLANFDTVGEAPAGVQRLRELILNLAICGRLVAQELDDEPAPSLLDRIAEYKDERARGQADVGCVGQTDQPFPIPRTWAWVPVASIADSRLGKMLDKAKNTGPLQAYIRNINVQWFRFDLSDVAHLRIEDDAYEEHAVRLGDLVICEGGEPGRAAVCDGSVDGMIFQKALHRVRPLLGISPHYLAYLLRSDACSGRLEQFFTGATIKHLTGRSLAKYPIPLPPVAEQVRIVAKVNELMARCDELDAREQERAAVTTRLRVSALDRLCQADTHHELAAAWNRIRTKWTALTDHSESVHAFRRTILDLAVKGLLVPGQSNKGGFAETTDRRPPLLRDPPPRWSLHTLESIADIGDGPFGSKLKTENYVSGPGYRVLRLGNIGVREFRKFDATFITEEHFRGLSAYHLEGGDLLVASLGNPPGRACCVPPDVLPALNKADCFRVRPSDVVLPDYLCVVLNSPRVLRRAAELNRGDTRGRITLSHLRTTLIPVPPLDEQGLIVQRVDQLLALCDELEAALLRRNDAAEAFAAVAARSTTLAPA